MINEKIDTLEKILLPQIVRFFIELINNDMNHILMCRRGKIYLSSPPIYSALNKFENYGLITKEKIGKNTKYTLTDKGKEIYKHFSKMKRLLNETI